MTKTIKIPLNGTGVTSIVTFGCLHLGKENIAAKNILLEYIYRTGPDGVLSGGDLSDCGQLRSSARNGEGGSLTTYQLTKAIEKEYNLTSDFVKQLRQTMLAHTWLAGIGGNHEERLYRTGEKYDIFSEKLTPEIYKRDWFPCEYYAHDYPLGQEIVIGKARFIHGRYFGVNHLKNHFDRYGANTFYWHTHEYAVGGFHKNTLGNAPAVGTLGCMEKILPDWMRGAPHKWSNCFQQWYFLPNGDFQMYNIMINNNKAILPDGTILLGKRT